MRDSLTNATDEALEHLEQRGKGCERRPFVLVLGCWRVAIRRGSYGTTKALLEGDSRRASCPVWLGLLKTLGIALLYIAICACIFLVIYIILLPFNVNIFNLERKNDFSTMQGFTLPLLLFMVTWVWLSLKEISKIPRYRFLRSVRRPEKYVFVVFVFCCIWMQISDADPLILMYSRRFLESEIELPNLNYPQQLAWDGNTLAIAGWKSSYPSPLEDPKIILWDVDNQKIRHEIKLQKFSYSPCPLQFSPDGKLLAGCGYIWETSGEPSKFKPDWENSEGWLNVGKDWRAIAFSQDNKLLALVKEGEVAVWRMTTGKRVLHLQDLDWVSAIAFSPDNQSLLLTTNLQHTRYENSLSLEKWNLTTGKLSKRFAIELIPFSSCSSSHCEREKPATAFSLEQERLVTNDCGHGMGGVQLWSTKTGLEIATLSKACTFSGFRFANLFSPDGKLLAVVYNETIAVWDVETQRVIRTLVFPLIDEPKRIAFSPDGRFLAGVHKKSVKIWRVTD